MENERFELQILQYRWNASFQLQSAANCRENGQNSRSQKNKKAKTTKTIPEPLGNELSLIHRWYYLHLFLLNHPLVRRSRGIVWYSSIMREYRYTDFISLWIHNKLYNPYMIDDMISIVSLCHSLKTSIYGSIVVVQVLRSSWCPLCHSGAVSWAQGGRDEMLGPWGWNAICTHHPPGKSPFL